MLNLSGEIINNFCSISEASRQLNYKTILKANTGAIIRKSYRLVTYKFYNENQNIISSWKNFSNMTRFIAERIKKKRMLLLEINNEIIEFKDRKELSKYLNVSKQYVEHVIKNGNFIKFKYPELNKIQNFKIKQ